MLQAAMKINPDGEPGTRLENTIFQRRATWLLANVDRWILPPLDESGNQEEKP
jgi:hypothetical protein